jgi:hypothetical protein
VNHLYLNPACFRYITTVPRKTSFYLDDDIEAILAAREGAPPKTRRHGQRSKLITLLLRRYEEVCQEDLPKLTPEEWRTILDASRSWSALAAENATSSVLITTLVEATKRLPAAEQNKELVQKVVAMTPGQRLAITDFVERHWAALERGDAAPPVPGAKTSGRRRPSSEGERGDQP